MGPMDLLFEMLLNLTISQFAMALFNFCFTDEGINVQKKNPILNLGITILRQTYQFLLI